MKRADGFYVSLKFSGGVRMRIFTLGVFALFLAASAVFNAGCYAHVNGAGLSMSIHDSRWHYDHDYDDNYRQNHPYARWDYDNNHDDQYRHDHPWHDEN
jgi:hypothetical protein